MRHFPMLAIMLIATVLNCSELNKPFDSNPRTVSDDIFLTTTIGQLELVKISTLFNPFKMLGPEGTGWFYRPVFLTYIRTVVGLVGPNHLPLHIFGLLLHLIATLLFVTLMARILKNQTIAYGAGLLFVLSTRQNEGIWWFSANSTLLAACFYLSTIHGLISFRERNSHGSYLLTLVSFPLALMSKEDALSLPLVLIFFDVLLYREIKLKDRLVSYVPFVVVGLGYLLLEYIAYINAYEKQFPLIPHFRLRFYIRFWHNAFFRLFGGGNALLLQTIIVLMVGIDVWRRRRNHILRAMGGWFFLACAPVPLATGMHGIVGDRFYYLPAMAASSLLLCWLIEILRDLDIFRCGFMAAVVATVIIRFVSLFITIPDDPFTVCGILLGIMVVSCILARQKMFPRESIPVVIVVAVFSQVVLYTPSVAWAQYNLQELAAVLVLVVWLVTSHNKDRILYLALTVFLLWPQPAPLLALYVLIMALWQRCLLKKHNE